MVAGIAVLAGGALLGLAIHQHFESSPAAGARKRVEQRAAAEAQPVPSAAGGVPLVEGASGGQHAPRSPAGGQAVSAIAGRGATLVIPALDVRAPIVATGGVNGAMVIPSDISEVGWYDGLDTASGATPATNAHRAPWPGQPGVAVVAGHVDWAGKGPGALYYLAELRVGDPVEVLGSNGVATEWRVSEAPITLSKDALPPTLFVNTGPPRVALVTCGGPFDRSSGHYLDNVIVWAVPAR